MKIVIAPDSYKESLNAFAVATAIEQGFREIWPDADYVKLPVADGGEGTVEAMVEATSGHIVHVDVTGPLGQQVSAFYGLSGDERTAFIEMAAASGLELVPVNKRNPLITTSREQESSFAMRLMRVLSISLLELAAVQPMMAVPEWYKHWERNCWMRKDNKLRKVVQHLNCWQKLISVSWIPGWQVAVLKWLVTSPIL